MSSDEADYTPALPPDLLPAKASTSSPPKPPTIGPSRPTFADLSVPISRPLPAPDDSDDDYGPMPLPAGVSAPESDVRSEWMAREEERERGEKEREEKRLERPEWMIKPPENLGFSVPDPTKLKARGFMQTNRPHKAVTSSSKDNSLWTETPQERAQRLEDEVLGKRKRATVEGGDEEEDEGERRKKKRDEEMREKVRELEGEGYRNESLVEKHRKKMEEDTSSKSRKKEKKEREKKEKKDRKEKKDKDKERSRKEKKKKRRKEEDDDSEEEDEKPPAIWDHDRDMGLKGRLMDEKSRNKYIAGAKDLGSKFGGGSYL
ncbi:hypothetical protein BT69DRAFT_1282387 [Atractiella rhizophila]|nr:hypothetical protein BT69DRAFT_1282387 [Atractiella rhizophila]